MLTVAARVLLPLSLMVGVYILLRGHNQPGGGFIAGLVVAIAFLMQYMASGYVWAHRRARFDAHVLIGGGVLIAGTTGLASLLFDRPFLTSTFGSFDIPLFGEVELASAMAFDIGVFFTVVGTMLLLASVVAFGVVIAALGKWDRRGRHFHALFQFQLLGIKGAFLTGDLFNLFVFFEVLLIASYGLMLHGGGPARLKAGFHYMAINLIGSTVFLFAVGIIYAVAGTLNMANLALKVPQVDDRDWLGVPVRRLVLTRQAAGHHAPPACTQKGNDTGCWRDADRFDDLFQLCTRYHRHSGGADFVIPVPHGTSQRQHDCQSAHFREQGSATSLAAPGQMYRLGDVEQTSRHRPFVMVALQRPALRKPRPAEEQ